MVLWVVLLRLRYLADCIISETAKRHGAVVLTMDHHFKLLGNAVIIEK
ncbi:hypothetical protein [Thermococcus sp.]